MAVMAGRIRASDIDEVKSRVNIADVVSDHVSLKAAGVGSLKGLCPFHDERSPSFHVRPGVGYYHCFGCGESGDVFSFLQKLDHMSFTEAVESLAARVGFTLTYEENGSVAPSGPPKTRLYAANAAAVEFYQQQLRTPGAEVGRAFLGARGFDAAAAAQFSVGFAPAGWDSLRAHLHKGGFTDAEMLAAGLLSQGDRGVYDRFRSRLVWPIRDITGQTVGFGARKLLDEDQGPKYLNTPETPIYHKAQVLYGLDLAKRDISRSHRVVVVEGYTDVMAAHLAGVTTAVATCGTAFGSEHLKLLKRILSDDAGLGEVVFTFDPDAAGQKAALRAFMESRSVAAQTFVAVGPDGLDPCDLRLSRGDSAVREMVDSRIPMFEYVIRHRIGQFNIETVEGRVSALRSAAEVLADIKDSMMRTQYGHEVARMLGMERSDVDRAVRAAATQQRSEVRGPSQVTAAAASSKSDADSSPDGPGATVTRQYRLSDLPNDPSTRLERDVLQVVLQQSSAVDSQAIDRALDASFQHPALSVIRDATLSVREALGTPAMLELLDEELPEGFSSLAREIALSPLPERERGHLELYCRGVINGLIDRELLRQKAELLSRLQRTAMTDTEAYQAIQKALLDIEQERRSLREET